MSATSMSVSMAMGTATSSGSSAASSAVMDMGSSMGMGGGDTCKISMLWNWYTIDACFLARSWHITSKGMFAGSCIGVVLLVMVLEALRRVAREYDAYLLTARVKLHNGTATLAVDDQKPSGSNASCAKGPEVRAVTLLNRKVGFRPTLFEQALRALLHMLQFAVAYFIMLLAMYYNGYIIICIFIGAFLGAFVFNWTNLGSTQGEEREITYCCG